MRSCAAFRLGGSQAALSDTGWPGASRGDHGFDDDGMDDVTKDMARAAELKRPPDTNLRRYLKYKGLAK
jgi:hypothetical protein